METTKLDSGGTGQRDSGGPEALSSGIRAFVPSTGTPAFHWAERTARVRGGGSAGRGLVGPVDYVSVRGRRRVSASAHTLDVVARDWRPGHWRGRSDFSSGTRRRLRHHRWTASGQRDHPRDFRRFIGEMVYLGGISGFRHVGRGSGAVVDDGWRPRRPRSHVSP